MLEPNSREEALAYAEDHKTGYGMESRALQYFLRLEAEMKKSLVVLDRLRELLLDQPWHRRCEIISDYMPPYPAKDERPTVQVRYNNGTEYPPFLRYSKGPKQGFFWDIYGEDMQSEALALLAIHQAPAPVDVGPIVVSLPLKKEKP